MKTQTSGLWTYLHNIQKSYACPWRHPAPRVVVYSFIFILSDPRDIYKSHRFNGSEEDFESCTLPYDGTITWLKGNVDNDYRFVYGEKNAKGEYEYECQYDAGLDDEQLMKYYDIKYLRALLEKGEEALKEIEPDVWRLREIDGAQKKDIGEWWSQKLDLQNIDEILAQSQQDYEQFIQEAKTKDATGVMENDVSGGRVSISSAALMRQCWSERDSNETREVLVNADQEPDTKMVNGF